MIANVSLPNGKTVTDARRRLERYFAEMGRGRKYEEWVHGDENRATPDRLTESNWKAAHWIFARGMSSQAYDSFFGDKPAHPLPLKRIPHEADLLKDWPQLQSAAGAVLKPMLACRGVGAANATKLLYQKRPNLFPILDSVVCDVIQADVSDKSVESVLNAIDAFRQAMLGNQKALSALRQWVRGASHLKVASQVRARISTVRIFDILCWGGAAD